MLVAFVKVIYVNEKITWTDKYMRQLVPATASENHIQIITATEFNIIVWNDKVLINKFKYINKIVYMWYYSNCFDSRVQNRTVKMKRTLAGSCGIGVFVIALVCIVVAFCAPSWLVSDYRITGAKLDRLGLWSHCFRSLQQPGDQSMRRFFVGCRWVYDPFTTGYDEIRGYLIPGL